MVEYFSCFCSDLYDEGFAGDRRSITWRVLEETFVHVSKWRQVCNIILFLTLENFGNMKKEEEKPQTKCFH